MSTITNSVTSNPGTPEDISRGSSVSTGFINEYEEILKYAIVAPKLLIGNNDLVGEERKSPDPEEKNSSTSASTSSSSYPLSSPHSKSNTKNKENGQLEVKVMKAKRAVDEYKAPKSFGSEKQLRFLNASNAMDTLLETPKDSRRITNKTMNSNESTPESLVGEIPSPSIDKDLIRMDAAMDDWCLQLKQNVLNELADMKKRQLQYEENAIEQLKSKHSAEILRLTHEVESLKELLYTFEQNIKQKDEVITNLTNVLNKQKERSEKIRLFSVWRLKHNDEQRNGFAEKMAEKFYKRTLMTKTWIAWRSVVENTWKKRVEKACQIKSQEICLKLTEDYEERLQALQNELAVARSGVAKMHTERDCYEENMKKAFMRGVCALNMEAMSMFKEGQQSECNTVEPPGVHHPCVSESTRERLIVNDQTSHSEVGPPPSQSYTNTKRHVRFNETNSNVIDTAIKQNASHRSGMTSNRKNIHVKMTGKKDYGALRKSNGSQSSSISSIKVERHVQPSSQPSSQPYQQQGRTVTPLSFSNRSETTMNNNCTMSRKPTSTSVVVD